MACRDIVVIGGSAGSGDVLRRILPPLPVDFPAAIFVATHMAAKAPSYLAEALNDLAALPVGVAIDGQPIEQSRIYVAPPDHHMLVFPGLIRLGRGPRENMSRPAIDALFRSAALAFDGRVIGVVLTGYLNDGAAGLFAIKRRGGLALVQHPLDAQAADMPEAALDAVEPDMILPADDIAAALGDLVGRPAPATPAPPAPDLELEVRIALGERLGSAELGEVAQPSALSCPHCHGVLSELQAPGPLRFRCQTGHAFTADAALAAQQPEIDEALMIALRVMEERVTLVERMGREARENGRLAIAELYEKRAEEYAGYARTLRQAAIRSLAPPAAAGE